MNCDETLNLLDPLVDGELPDREQGAVRLHLDGCATCQHELRQIKELREMLRQAPRYAAPDSLLNNVREQIANVADRPALRPSWNRWVRPLGIKPIVTHAAAALVGAVFFYGAIQMFSAPATPTREIVAAHVRSLMDDRLTQVSSNDTHTVAPWFAGRIDFAPLVKDLSAEGFPLIGGRIDYLQDRKVAALVYQRRKHRINLFIFPDTGKQTEETVDRSYNGYNIVGWRDKNFAYWAISDLNLEELTAFSKLSVAM